MPEPAGGVPPLLANPFGRGLGGLPGRWPMARVDDAVGLEGRNGDRGIEGPDKAAGGRGAGGLGIFGTEHMFVR